MYINYLKWDKCVCLCLYSFNCGKWELNSIGLDKIEVRKKLL